jgi:hypothetical protein
LNRRFWLAATTNRRDVFQNAELSLALYLFDLFDGEIVFSITILPGFGDIEL